MRHGFEPYNTWDLLTQREIDTPTVKTSLKATCQYSNFYSLLSRNSLIESLLISTTGADPGFFLGGGALVSCFTSTPINQVVFFLAEYQLY